MNDNATSRTAPATKGLLKIHPAASILIQYSPGVRATGRISLPAEALALTEWTRSETS